MYYLLYAICTSHADIESGAVEWDMTPVVHKCFGLHCAKNTHAAFISIVVMWRAIRDIQENRIFTFKTMPAQLALRMATTVMGWTSHHPNEAQAIALRMQDLLKSCLSLKDPSTSNIRGAIWSKYHSLCTLEKYLGEWKEFLLSTGCGTTSSLFIQFVGHSMFKTLIKAHYCHNKPAVTDDRSQDLSHIEFNAIRYTAGYVPRALKKKPIKSGHKNKKGA